MRSVILSWVDSLVNYIPGRKIQAPSYFVSLISTTILIQLRTIDGYFNHYFKSICALCLQNLDYLFSGPFRKHLLTFGVETFISSLWLSIGIVQVLFIGSFSALIYILLKLYTKSAFYRKCVILLYYIRLISWFFIFSKIDARKITHVWEFINCKPPLLKFKEYVQLLFTKYVNL